MIDKDEELFFDSLLLDRSTVEGTRQSTLIKIVAGIKIAQSYVGQVMLESATNLCARVFPHLEICVPNEVVSLFKKDTSLQERLISIKVGSRSWNDNLLENPRVINLVVGCDSEIEGEKVAINASGWLAVIGEKPYNLGSSFDINPIGAIVASCLGTAELFKRVYGRFIPQSGQIVPVQFYDVPTVFSALTYETDSSEITSLENPAIGKLFIKDAVQFGVGSIGSSVLHALSLIPNLQGRLIVVDKDGKIDEHNILRYSFLDEIDLIDYKDVSKVIWASEKLKKRCTSLEVLTFDGTVQEWLNELPIDYKIDLAISAVDSALARRDITDVLAKTTINAGTGTTNLEITRHGFGNGRGCLYCRFIGNTPSEIAEAKDYSKMSGLAINRVIKLLGEEKLTDEDLDLMVGLGKLGDEEKQYWIGGQLRSLARERLYSQVQLTSQKDQRIITLAFVSTMAGALLAGELIKLNVYNDIPLGYEFRMDMLKHINLPLVSIQRNPKCLCNNSFRLQLYKNKYQE